MEQSIIFPNLHITLNNVGKGVEVFGFYIAFYGMIIGLGMLLGVGYILREAKRLGKSEDEFIDICMITIVLSVVGARLYYVIFAWDYYKDDLLSIFNIRRGGLAIYGGVLTGIVCLAVISKVKKMNYLELLDICIGGVVIGQIFGRWGNFFNREAFGRFSDGLFSMQVSINSIRSMDDVTDQMIQNIQVIDGVQFISVHPTFLYESMWNLALLIFVFCTRKNKKFNGQIFFEYLIWYGAGRFWIEGLRTDQLKLWATGLPVSQVVAAVMVVLGVGMYFYNRKTKSFS